MMEEPQPNHLRHAPSHSIRNILSYPQAFTTRTMRWWQTLDSQHQKVLLSLGVGMILIVVILAVWKIPQRQLAPLKAKIQRERNNLQPQDRLKLEHDARKLENDARTALIQAVGGLVLFISLYFTAKAWRTAQEGQITDRFTKAINQLGEAGPENLALRLGGIYALERIARDSERDHWPIMEILTAYVREHAPWPPKDIPPLADDLSPTEKSPEGKDPLQLKPMPDIQAILTVLGRRTRYFGKGEDLPLNLVYTDLRWAVIQLVHLEGADLRRAHLEGADLEGAHLEGARELTVEQLSTVKTLYLAELDPPLLEQIQRLYPQLLERPWRDADI
jgi:hypothetical protein